MKAGSVLRDRHKLGHYHLSEFAAAWAFLSSLAVLWILTLAALSGAFLAGQTLLRALLCMSAGATLTFMIQGFLIEPYRLKTTEVPLGNAKVKGHPLRLIHLSDLHVRSWGGLERQMLQEAKLLKPDLILLSGDYTASPTSVDDTRRLMSLLCEIAPVYACRGNSEYRKPPFEELFRGTQVNVLLSDRSDITVKGSPVSIFGVDPGEEEDFFALGAKADTERFSICLYHYPDFVPDLEKVPYDLMLCGHTHGGQVRLPYFGALVSLCRAGTRYSAGLFQKAGRSAYVSRGVGSESYGLPPLRWRCPPELVLLTVSRPA